MISFSPFTSNGLNNNNNNNNKKHYIQQQKVKPHGILFTGTKGISLSRDSKTIFESGRVTFSCCYLLSGDQWLCKFLVTKDYFTWEKSSVITAFYWLACVAGVESGRGLRGRGVPKIHSHGYHFIVLYTNMAAMTSYENDLLSWFNPCQFHTWYKIIADIQRIQHDQVTKRR